ncbi:MAG: DsbA family protein [Deltaproteobacteria bacterium]|nr:DsbA family protein [Deltaproteobacteria bacterium]
MHRSFLAAVGSFLVAASAGVGCVRNKVSAPAPGDAPRTSCAEASLALDDSAVVGTFDGKDIAYKDLGPGVQKAERKALHQYCDAVAQARRVALENHVTDALVQAKAAKAGVDKEAWMKAEIDKRVPEPDDADVQAFYDAQKARMGDQLPPVEVVRPQVVGFLKREKTDAAVDDVIGGLLQNARFERRLPDVRSPAVDLAAAAGTPVKGKADAKVRLVEFADFQCPYCSRAADTVKELAAKYGDQVEFSYRHFPLRSIHPEAQRASEIAACAGEQGRFWEAHDALYAKQDKLDEASVRQSVIAAGVDAAKLEECLASGRATTLVDRDFKKGEEIGVEGTPSFFVNGRPFTGNPTVSGLSQALDEELGR